LNKILKQIIWFVLDNFNDKIKTNYLVCFNLFAIFAPQTKHIRK